MSLQETERFNTRDGTMGMEKKIDESSQRMIMDVLQATQYTKPIQSSIRELASNSVDSQREKEIAYDILSNGVDPSKYFIEREGDQFKDSKWDPSYFDLEFLDMSKNTVHIHYTENPGNGFCDEIAFTDFGIGLGEKRLKGYFKLGWSSKRNTKQTLGAFGLS